LPTNKTKLNGHEYDVDQKFIDTITSRVNSRLLKSRSDRVMTDDILVKSELLRLYGPGIEKKPWFKDFIIAYCASNKIRCRVELL